jgi:HK97 family phage portal protein
MREATVMTCIRILSETMGQFPLITYRRLEDGGKERARDHYLYDLLSEKPNKFQTSYNWRGTMMLHFGLRGRAYSRIVYSSSQGISELIPIHPDRVRTHFNDHGEKVYEVRDFKTGNTEILLSDQIFHLMDLSPDGLDGIDRIQLARETIGNSIATLDFGARFFANDAKPAGIFTYPGQLDTDSAERIKESWDSRFRGGGQVSRDRLSRGGHEI